VVIPSALPSGSIYLQFKVKNECMGQLKKKFKYLHLSCTEKKCQCLLGGENQYYEATEKRCISYIGGQCLQHYSNPCPKNSYCGEISENIHGSSFVVGHKCICSGGNSYTRNRQCLARYGTECNSNLPCNYDEFLGCLNGKCKLPVLNFKK